MKHLLIVRHAKSGWDEDIKADFDRRLTKQGNKDAEEMATLIHKSIPKVDIIISSAAARALSTAQYFANIYNIQFNSIVADIGLYEKNYIYAKRFLATQADTNDTILLVAHNPMLTNMLMNLTNKSMPALEACSVSYVELPIEHWQDISNCIGKLIFTEAPVF